MSHTNIERNEYLYTVESGSEIENNAKCDAAVQTELTDILQVSLPCQPTTTTDEENESSTIHSTNQLFTSNVSSYDNSIELPLQHLSP